MRRFLRWLLNLLTGRRQRPSAKRRKTLATLRHEKKLERNPVWMEELLRRGQPDGGVWQ